ncbi:hypothetical protein ACLQ2N_16295 [Streptomyces sp. DT224]|uniref:hypothetical protein n=1 Tax=Streptomyces sp. DT224 TaxID=3393426 RepID=UPI003CEA3D00
MDATAATQYLTHLAQNAFERDAQARESLAAALAIPGASIDHLVDAALTAAAIAKPWTHLMKAIERHGVRDGLARARTEATDLLVTVGVSVSTNLVTTAQRLAEQEGARRFLSTTGGLEVEGEAAAGEPALAG